MCLPLLISSGGDMKHWRSPTSEEWPRGIQMQNVSKTGVSL